MKTAREIYPLRDDESEEDYYNYFCVSNYQPMVEEFGPIAIQVDDDDDYHGDTYVLYQYDSGKFAYLNFGWGSCSGCDSLQACRNIDEVQQLMDDLKNDIIVFDDLYSAKKYFEQHDWEGDYNWRSGKHNEFIEKSLAYLEENK
jgi:hypothetical protein